MRQGEIWWIERPDHKRRPALVLTRDESLGSLYDILVVPLTTTVRHLPTEVPLGPEDGVPRESVANLQNVTTLPRSMMRSRAGELAPGRWHEVCAALRVAIDC